MKVLLALPPADPVVVKRQAIPRNQAAYVI